MEKYIRTKKEIKKTIEQKIKETHKQITMYKNYADRKDFVEFMKGKQHGLKFGLKLVKTLKNESISKRKLKNDL
jgi:hypothetical protein